MQACQSQRNLTFPLICVMVILFLPGLLLSYLALSQTSTPLLQKSGGISDTEIAGLLNTVVIDDHSHAIEEHPNSAPIVRDCLAEKGAYMQFQIEPKKRYLRVCIVDEAAGHIGFQIVDIVNRVAKERTAYIKEDLRCIKDVLNYVGKRGWHKFKAPL